MKHKVADLSLAAAGRLRIEWAESRMPVLMTLRDKGKRDRPLKGMRIAGCLHVTKETAVLIRTLVAAGAEVSWSGCNPLSTSDEVSAALAADEISIYAWHGSSTDESLWCIDRTLELEPTLTLDNGTELLFRIQSKHGALARTVIGGTEETTTGVHRLRAMAAAGRLPYPIFAVNDSETTWDFDNVYGTGQSTLDGILRTTNVLFAGRIIVVAGYGHCGRGVATRAKGMGADVIVTEVKPTQGLKARLEGVRVMTMDQASQVGDVFITATGMKDVLVGRHFDSMKDGAIVCNTGHHDCEINLPDLAQRATTRRQIRDSNEEFVMRDGRRIYLLGQGRPINLTAAEGHPSEVMDMLFANQYLALCELARRGKTLEKKIHGLPKQFDQELAMLKLKTLGIAIDSLTSDQLAYHDDYAAGEL